MRKRQSVSERGNGPALYVVAGLLLVCAAAPAQGQWTQWGGPRRDFSSDSTGLAEKWPEGGPRKLWTSEIGHGHSSILVDGKTLYTMCRRGDKDAVLAYDADTGRKLWETQYDAPTKPGMQLEFGAGPHSTPLVVGDRIFTVGAMVQFHCLDKTTGKILWGHDLMEELGASHLQRGYGASPIAYRDTVILNVGGSQAGVAAFKQEDGELVWKSEPFRPACSSPILVRFNDEDHLACALGADRVGLDPATGKTKWRATVDSQSFGIMATPLWIEPDLLFCSAGYGGGSRLFRLAVNDGEYTLEELWHYRKMQVVHGAMARVGNVVYGSSHGSFGPAFLMGIDLTSGKPLFRTRGMAKANVMRAGGRFIILDEQGNLALATVTPDGFDIHSQAKVFEDRSWTCPTLVGTTLYLRDYHTIMALDLSTAGNAVANKEVR